MDSDISFFSIHSLYSFQSELMATYGIVILILCLAALFLAASFKSRIIEFKNKKNIKKLGILSLSDVTISVSLDETIFIDYLVLTANGLMVLKILKYNGIIFCGENLEQWTQLINKKSFKFPNPLHELNTSVSVLQSLIKDCNVFGHIIFEPHCEFPKGKPTQVYMLNELRDKFDSLNESVSEKLKSSWQSLKQSEYFKYNIKYSELNILLKEQHKSKKTSIGIFLVLLALFWLIYRYTEQNWIEIFNL